MAAISPQAAKIRFTYRTKKVEQSAPPPRKTEVVPTMRIIGLNFPVEKHAEYFQSQAERRASVGACLICEKSPLLLERITRIAGQLGLPIVPRDQATNYDYILQFSTNKIQLATIEKPPLFNNSGPIYCDFAGGTAEYRRTQGKYSRKSPIARAVSVPGKTFEETHVVDATGGLGVDAFTLAFLGFKVTVIERDPIIYTLLQDGYQRGVQCQDTKKVLERMTLIHSDSFDYFNSVLSRPPSENDVDVVFLDPMYPLKDKVALPKKAMMIARRFLPKTSSLEEFIEISRKVSKYKVVLKRPYYEKSQNPETTTYSGRSTNFEVYASHNRSNE